ncbi:unnamed protein product [Camellia sinensis]
MSLSSLMSLTVVVYVQENVGWGLGLGIPTIIMAFSTVVYVLGSPLYKKIKPGGSPFVRLAQAIVAAWKKRKEVAPEDLGKLYENRELDALISSTGRLLHTDQFKWLDRAAIVTEDDAKEQNSPNYCPSGILLAASESNSGNLIILQARSMDRHFSHSSSFQIPPASLSTFSILINLIGLVLYDSLFVPIARLFTRNHSGITCLQRMGIGIMLHILANIVSALVEMKRKAVAADHNLLDQPTAVIPITVFWLLPQYCISGIAVVFLSVGHMEFLYDESPESMRSTSTALYWVAISVGSYMGTLMVSLIHKYTGNDKNWLPDRNLNRGRLENYYWLMGGIQVINLLYFVVCAWFYTYNPLEEVIDSNKEGDVEFGSGEGDTTSKALSDANGNVEVALTK